MFFYYLKIFKKDFIYLFLERGKGREKERESNINVWLPLACPLLGTWPTTQASALDWESNQRLFDLQAGTQSTEPHQLELFFIFRKSISFANFQHHYYGLFFLMYFKAPLLLLFAN